MENGVRKSVAIRDVIIASIASFLLYYMGFGELIFVFPLLLISTRYGKGFSAAAILLETILVLASSYFLREDGAIGFPIMLIDLYIPLSLLAAGTSWLISERKSFGLRLFYALIPSCIFLIALIVYLGRDTALYSSVFNYYQDVFEAMLSPFLNVDAFDHEMWNAICSAFIMVMLSLLLPIVLCFACATLFTFESVLHSRESEWEDRVARLELDGKVIWIFLALWLLILLSRFISLPTIAVALLFNVALSFTISYAIQGFSVLYYRLRKRGRKLKSYTLFLILIAIVLFVPGINIIIVLGLPLIGVLETFIELRK